MSTYLKDGDEVLCNLVSADLWLRVIYRFFNMQKMMMNGSVEMRVDNTDTVYELKKKL